jgi:ankyrin repeat protein
MIAIQHSQKDIVQYLLENGADVNTSKRDQKRAIHIAAHTGNKDVLEVIFNQKADVNEVVMARDVKGDLPLFIAVMAGHDDAVEEFLKDGFDLTITNWNRQTALHLACQVGSLPISRKLVDRGARLDSRDVFGNTPLHYAAMGDWHDIVNTLLTHRADATIRNAKNKSPFFYASVQVAKLFRHHFQSEGAFDHLVQSAQTQKQLAEPPRKANQETKRGTKAAGSTLTPRRTKPTNP